MTIKRALLSVSDKTGLIDFAKFLQEEGVEILSTGGTAQALRKANIRVTDVSDYTGSPEIMDGRVKTLHPKIHGGILSIRDNDAHMKAMADHVIAPIDLVVVNLYPFESTVASDASFETCIENIDIGGPSMVRSAAKNNAFVTIIVEPSDYALVIREMKSNNGATSTNVRRFLAAKAFCRTSAYDSAISQWFNAQNKLDTPDRLTISGTLKQTLHYGENPHQNAAFYKVGDEPSLASALQMQGAELSYNNLNDASAAFELVREFDEPAVVIVKHANPCGVAIANTITEAFKKALACDPVSAYGGIIATNRPITKEFCDALGKLFLEVMIVPDADDSAKEQLSSRKKLKLLIAQTQDKPKARKVVKSISGGFLYQDDDTIVLKDDVRTATKTTPSDTQMDDLIFAFTVAKHTKSNTIILARDKATIGIGAGQMSRIDSTRIACWKAQEANLSTEGCVLASDAFFPFSDNVEMAAKAGIKAVIQPGGSIRDDEVIKSANTLGVAMVFTGIRHFRH